jgi:hypothetical protein
MPESTIMKLLRLCLLACALVFVILGASVPAKSKAGTVPAIASPPEVSFQVVAARDAVNRGDSLGVVFSVANRSDVRLDNLKITTFPQDSKITFSPPALDEVSAFGSESKEATGKVADDAGFETHHLVFVLQYRWKAASITYTSTQTATLNVQVNRQFEEEAKGLPGGTAALLYLILPVMTILLAYEFVDSLRKGQVRFPEFKSEYIASAFVLAILLNFVLIYKWQHDQSFLYATPRRFALSLAVLAAAGALIPSIRGLIQGWNWCLYTFRNTDSKEEYLKKVLHQTPTGDVTWTKAKIDGVDWEGAVLEQPNGSKVLGACLQISAKQEKLAPEELKKVVDDHGTISDRKRLLQFLKEGSVSLEFAKRITESERGKDMLFVGKKDMTIISEGSAPEKIVKFVL